MASDDSSMSTSEAGRRGGKAQGKDSNPANFANDREKAKMGGKHSRRSGSNTSNNAM